MCGELGCHERWRIITHCCAPLLSTAAVPLALARSSRHFRPAMSKSSNTAAADAALAAKLQAEEDAVLAQRLEDERLALAHDPWQQAEAEWDTAMKQHDANSGAKVAKEMHAQEAHALKLKAQREEEDRKLAQQIAANGTPVKGKK